MFVWDYSFLSVLFDIIDKAEETLTLEGLV